MTPFAYVAVADTTGAVAHGQRARAEFIAGGTDMLQLLQEGVRAPGELVDINRLPFGEIEVDGEGARIGALVRLAQAAGHPLVRERYRAVAEALAETASGQVRNQATMGGNLLQRTRCSYFRDTAAPCNKRAPGSGCGAMDGQNRMNAILGTSDACIATYPGDLAVALLALEALIQTTGPQGGRQIAMDGLHRLPGTTPERETELQPGELITGIVLPAAPEGRRSHYLKVRDRASFEWALASAAVVLDLDGRTVRRARIAVGGVATRPWRLPQVEQALEGRELTPDLAGEAAAGAAEGAVTHGRNAFKVELLRRTVARAIVETGGMP